MPSTVTDLGQKVKAKYPGIYDDIPDDQLGVKIQTKFPGAYDDFINTSLRPSSVPQPTLLDRISTELNGGGAMLDPKAIVQGVGNSLGRTTQAWEDFLTGHTNASTIPSMVPLLGPAAVDASQKLFTPGRRVEGLTDMGAMLAPELAAGPMPSIPESTLPVLKGAAKGAAKSAMERVPMGGGMIGKFIGTPEAQVPAIIARPIQAAAAGGILGREAGIGAEPGAIAGGVTGTVAPLVRGAISGGKEALRDFRFKQELANRPAPVYSDNPSTTRPDINQYGLPPDRRTPVEVGGTSITGMPTPDFTPAQSLPAPKPVLSGKPSTPGLSNVPKPPVYEPDAIDTNALFQQQFGRPPQGPQLGPAKSTAAPVDLSRVVLPDWYGTPKSPAPVASTPTELLDQVAQGFGYKKFSAIKDPKAASTVRNLASQVSTQDFTPPGTAGVLAPDVHPVATPTIQPIAGGAAPAGNNIVYPESVHQQLRPAGPDVAITHASNASAKDLAVAGRLKQSGITLPAFDAMTDAELNQHYRALGYKNLGSDYAPGKRVGRDAATGRAHLRQVLSELQ